MPDEPLEWSRLIRDGRWVELITDAARSGDPELVRDAALLVETAADGSMPNTTNPPAEVVARLPRLVAWVEMMERGTWAELVTDAVSSGDRTVIADAGHLVRAGAPDGLRERLVKRMYRVWRGEWDSLVADAAAADHNDAASLRRGLEEMSHVADLITAGVPDLAAQIKAGHVDEDELVKAGVTDFDRYARLMRRVAKATEVLTRCLEREIRKAQAAGEPMAPKGATAPQQAQPKAATRPAARDRSAPARPAPARPLVHRVPEAAERSEVTARLESAEAERWAWQLGKYTKKVNERREKRGQAPVVLTDELVAASLEEWHKALTVEGDPLLFVSEPAWTGLCLARWLCERYPVIPTPTAVPADSILWQLPRRRGYRMVRTVGWFDREALVEIGSMLVGIDVNCQHLSAARGVELGDGEPTHVLDAVGAQEWITTAWRRATKASRGAVLTAEGYQIGLKELVKRPGYLVLGSAPDLSDLPTHARLAFAKVGAHTILPMPLASYLVVDHGVVLDVAEAIFWDTRPVFDPQQGKDVERRAYGRRLEKWAIVVTDGRKRLIERATGYDADHPAALALSLLKPMYSMFTGAFLRSTDHNRDRDTGEPTGWLRPDWYDQLLARASANMLRALDKAAALGLVTVGALKDSVWFVTEAPADGAKPAAPAGLEESTTSGKWKVDKFAVVDDAIMEAHALGRPVPVREALTNADNARARAQNARAA